MVSEVFNVAERTDLAVATHLALGLTRDAIWASDFIGRRMQNLHDVLNVRDGPISAVGVETFMPINLGSLALTGLIDAYNNMRRKGDTKPLEAYVWHALWGQYNQDSQALNRRSFKGNHQLAATQARAMLHGGDKAEGLYFTDQTLTLQIARARAFMRDYGRVYTRSSAELMNPADIVMINAQRQLEGVHIPLLDSRTFTRFPQVGMRPVDGEMLIGNISSSDGVMRLGRSHADADRNVGLRISLGP